MEWRSNLPLPAVIRTTEELNIMMGSAATRGCAALELKSIDNRYSRIPSDGITIIQPAIQLIDSIAGGSSCWWYEENEHGLTSSYATESADLTSHRNVYGE